MFRQLSQYNPNEPGEQLTNNKGTKTNTNGTNNITNNMLVNLKTVNTSGSEWNVPIGNNSKNNVIPANLKYNNSRRGGKRRQRKRRTTKRRR